MDLLSIRPDSIEIEIVHPGTRQPLGLVLTCVSLEDERVKEIERTLKNKALRGGRNSVTAEKLDENTLLVLATTIKSWNWPESLTLGDLSNPECNSANKKKLVSIPWIASQIDVALGDESAFFTKSAVS